VSVVAATVNVVAVSAFTFAVTPNVVAAAASRVAAAAHVDAASATVVTAEATTLASALTVFADAASTVAAAPSTVVAAVTTFAEDATTIIAAGNVFVAATTTNAAAFVTSTGNRHGNEEDIMTITNAVHRSVITMRTSVPVATVVAYALNLVAKMQNNPAFATPTPTLAAITAAANDLAAAEQTASQKTKGAVTLRNDKRAVLVTLLHQLRSYVQSQADANLENGQAIIESAGMTVKKTVARKARVFAARPGTTSGTVHLTTPSASKRAAYDWQYSIDGGKTWVAVPSTLKAQTTVSGLTAGATVMFRYQSLTKAGEGDWSQPVSFTVK
jgi:hypothetical protein